jgi:hypothetical protein
MNKSKKGGKLIQNYFQEVLQDQEMDVTKMDLKGGIVKWKKMAGGPKLLPFSHGPSGHTGS